MSWTKVVPRVLLGGVASVLLGGSTCHIPVRAQPTPNPGECLILSDGARHASDDVCASAPADVDAEPNGTLFTAVQLMPAACGGVQLHGTLGAPDDVDFFALPRCALPFLSSSPLDRSTREPVLTFSGDDDSEVCLFAACSYGPTTLQGCSGSVQSSSPDAGAPGPIHLQEGMLGCCRRGPGTLATVVSCDSTTPEVTGYVMVESVKAVCHQGYQVNFSVGSL